jgi:hypothetical protein
VVYLGFRNAALSERHGFKLIGKPFANAGFIKRLKPTVVLGYKTVEIDPQQTKIGEATNQEERAWDQQVSVNRHERSMEIFV